ncbi:PAS domain S-box protein [Candidatus Latescibacterota bacterium]
MPMEHPANPDDVVQRLRELETAVGQPLAPVEQMLESLVSALPDIVYRLDHEGRIVYISEAIRKYGYDPAELAGQSIFAIIHPDDQSRARHRIDERRTGGRRTRSLELRLVSADQVTVDMELRESTTEETPTLLVDAEGVYESDLPRRESFLYTQGVARDVTERRRLEEALATARDEMGRRIAERTAQIERAYEQLHEEAVERQRRHAEQGILQRLRDRIWQMRSPDEIDSVISALRDGLEEVGLSFHGIGINVVEGYPSAPRVRYYQAGSEDSWDVLEEGVADPLVIRTWQSGEVRYRRDVAPTDPPEEAEEIEEAFGPGIRSLLEVPFSRGTLVINSRQPEAFTERDVALMEQLAAGLSEGFQRLDDLQELARRTAQAEAMASSRQDALFREEALGRIRDRIISMRRMEDLPSEIDWVAEIHSLGVPIRGISLQVPGSSPDTFATYYLTKRAYSADIPLSTCPWIREVWDSGEPVLVDRQRLESMDWGGGIYDCILEVPVPGGGSLAVNNDVGLTFDEDMIRVVRAIAGLVAEGVQRTRDFEVLEEGERRYRSLVEGLPIGVIHVATDGRILYHNPYVEAALGYSAEELSQIRSQELLKHRSDRVEVFRALAERGVHSFEYELRRRGGKTVWVRGTMQASGELPDGDLEYHGFLEDVTDRKLMETEYGRLEEQLRQAQKMEAMGRLTAGIAHNFNNMLQGISGNLQLALLDAPERLRTLLQDADEATRRAGEMVRQLMIYSRQGVAPEEQVIDIRRVIEDTVGMCSRTFDKKIRLRTRLPSSPLSVSGDEGLLQQVLLNLCLNARDALEEARPMDPEIVLSAERVEVDDVAEVEDHGRRPGTYAQVVASDNGSGMDKGTRQRIFDPFFTTKPMERGTGLGLATVYGIVGQHHGWVECDSQVGRGTSFSVYLPVAAQMPDSLGIEVEDRSPSIQGQPPLVLVIDDEEVVRTATSRLLTRSGFRTLEAPDGAEGVGIYRQRQEEIDVVLLDLSMPGMSGREALAAIRQINADAAVVIFTGYGAPEGIKGATGILEKPFTLDELSRAIRCAMASETDTDLN